MSLDQLMQAFTQFGDTAKEYGAARGIDDATKEVERLKNDTQLSYQQRIAAQDAAAKQLQARLSGLGTPVSQIQAAVGAVAPTKITSSAQAVAAAQQATDPEERKALLAEAKTFQTLEGENALEIARPLTSFQTDEAIRLQRARASTEKAGAGPSLSPAQKKFDEEMAKKLADWEPSTFAGGEALLSEAASALASGSVSTGVTGKIAAMVPGSKTAEVGNKVRAAIQEMLRPIYGAQFTEKEGDRFFATIYDPGAKEADNIARLNVFREKAKAQAAGMQRAQEIFDATGSFQGAKRDSMAGGLRLLGELKQGFRGDKPLAPPAPAQGLTPAEQKSIEEELKRRKGM